MALLYDSIERFPQAHYEIHVGWKFLEEWLESQKNTGMPGSGLDLDPHTKKELNHVKELLATELKLTEDKFS